MSDAVVLSDVEQLIVETAFYKAVASDLKTKTPDNLRGRVDAMMEDAYYNSAIAGKSFDLLLKGAKVGTYSLTITKPEPQKVETRIEVKDRDKLYAWAEEHGFIEQRIDMAAIEDEVAMNGVVPEGCEIEQVVIPETVGGAISKSTLKVDAEKVADVLGGRLAEVAHGILTEAKND